MKIEEELDLQSSTETQKSLINILLMADRIGSAFNSVLKPYGISKEQYNVLRILVQQHPKPVTIQFITQRMISKSSNVTRLVEKIRQKGLVRRVLCATDRRKVDVMLTEAGLDLLRQTDPLIVQAGEAIQPLSEAEKLELNRLLNKMRE